MIVKLTHPDEDAPPIYVNILHITSFYPADKKVAMPHAETFVFTSDSPDEMQVRETPDEVEAKIAETVRWIRSQFYI
jgi:hypothetical protein